MVTVTSVDTNANADADALEGASFQQQQEDGDGDLYVFPTSFAQQQMWTLDRLTPGSAAYIMPSGIRITGRLDVAALERGLAEIVRRHETLRTTFTLRDGQLVGIVAAAPSRALDIVDVGSLPPGEREETVARLSRADARRPFDLSRGPLLRATLLRCGDAEHVLLLTVHHIVFDGWSRDVLTRELSVLYNAYTRGVDESPLPELSLQYADVAVWQREWMQGAALQAQLDYWRARLAGAPPVLELPTDHPRPATRSFVGALHRHVLPAPLVAALERLSLEEGVTLFMTCLAAFQALLARYSGQDDLVVGTPLAGRTRAEFEPLIGYFVNVALMRTDLSGDPSFRELLGRVRETALDAFEHQDAPFERLIQEVQPERDPSRNPLFQVAFVFQNTPPAAFAFDGLAVSPLDRHSGTAKFDLTLSLEPGDGGDGSLVAFFEYDAALFDAATIARMAGHLETLLAGAVADPACPLSALPLATAAERETLTLGNPHPRPPLPAAGEGETGSLRAGEGETSSLRAGEGENEAPVTHLLPSPAHGRGAGGEGSLHALFERQAARAPDAVAVSCGDATLTYRELDEQANRLARYLCGHGVGPGAYVGLLLDRSLWTAVGILGILKTGAAYVPLDPAYPRERLDFMLRDAGIRVLLTRRELVPAASATPGLRVVALDEEWPPIEPRGAVSPEGAASGDARSVNGRFGDAGAATHSQTVSGDDAAYVIYTSGSTGTPKGVVVTHHNVVRLFTSTRDLFGFDERDVWTLFHSYAFDFSVWELWGALLHGGRLVVVPFEVSRSPDAFYALLERERVTVLNQTPSAFGGLARVATARDARRALALRLVIFGGEALDLRGLRPWFDRYGDTRPRLVNMYGITETTVHVTYRPLRASDPDSAPGSMIGRPLPDLRLYVLDGRGQPAPVGVPGELYVGGAGVARGYLGQPALTAARFVHDPFSHEPGARLYRSGDRARYRSDGDLEYLGRIDGQVKVRGYRIEVGEIEAVLARQEGVVACAVVVREDTPGDRRLVAYVVADPTRARPAASDEWRRGIRAHLPEYMVPASFGRLDRLPLTPNGKIDRRALPSPPVERSDEAARRDHVAPRTPLERALARIWEDLLDVGPVGVRDNFFDLGGHSLLAVRLLDRIERVCGRAVPLSILFGGATIERLAAALEDGGDAPQRAVVPLVEVQGSGSRRPFYFLHGDMYGGYYCLKIARRLGAERPFYALPPHGLDGWQVPRTVEAIASYHVEVLRAFQPRGPYLLGGFCNGGVIAYEMARQLQAEGQQVDRLVIIDAAATTTRYALLDRPVEAIGRAAGWDARRRAVVSLGLHYYVARWYDALRLGRRDQVSLALQAGRRMARRARGVAARRDTTAASEATLEARGRALLKDYWMARRRYSPPPYDGDVVLLWPVDQKTAYGADATQGWGVVARRVDVRAIPGTHETCTTEHIGALSDCLRACLDEADTGLQQTRD